LEEQLDPNLLLAPTRHQIVNLKWIAKVDQTVAGGLTLRGGRTLQMSRRNRIVCATYLACRAGRPLTIAGGSR
jgi:DNA-binding LytR/AlgR family response regulator